MTAVNLVPLAAQTANNPIIQQLTSSTTMTARTSKDSNSSSNKSLSPLLRPQALLLNPDVLVRATLAERLATSQGLTSALRSSPTFTSTAALLAANPLRTLQRQQELQRQILQLQQIQKTQSPAATAKDIIGMGIHIPNPTQGAPKTTAAAVPVPTRRPPAVNKKVLEKTKKMMKYGKPLLAPPRLASKIYKRSKRTPMTLKVNDTSSRPTQRRKLHNGTPTVLLPPPSAFKTLSSDELDFVEAARRLHHSSASRSSSPKTDAAAPSQPLTQKALKPPPALSF